MAKGERNFTSIMNEKTNISPSKEAKMIAILELEDKNMEELPGKAIQKNCQKALQKQKKITAPGKGYTGTETM